MRACLLLMFPSLYLPKYSPLENRGRANFEMDLDSMPFGEDGQRTRVAGWGWYSPYPMSRFEGDMAFHYLVPFVNLCARCIMHKTAAGLPSVATLPDMLERKWHSSEEHVRFMLHYEQSRDGFLTCWRTLKLFQDVLSDEVLLVSQLRADSFLARQGVERFSANKRMYIGCAGLQDREDLHLNLFRCLEVESGHNGLLKLLDSFQRPTASAARVNHKGLDELACVALNVLERLVLYRCDNYLVCNDRNLEGAVLQLAAPLVHCMSRFALPVGLPSRPEQFEPQLPFAASRLLSLVCRLDLRPLTIRQSWEWREKEYVKLCISEEARLSLGAGKGGEGRPAVHDRATKRALLDLATCHGQPVDTRVAVLAFLAEALASQPGLADWLFDSDGDFPGANALSSEAGCARGADKKSITLDNRAMEKDGYYNGWIVEIRGGKGQGQPPVVISSYDGKTKIATLSKVWDTDGKIGTPDHTSQYLISKQLQLRRIIKAFLHPRVSFSGLAPPSRASSERMLNRLKIMEYTLMLVETVWDTAPEERAGIVQGFSDADCLIWGLASPDQGKIVNKTNHWREYNLHLYTTA